MVTAFAVGERRASERIRCKNVLVVFEKVGFLDSVVGTRSPKTVPGKQPTPVVDISRVGMRFLSKQELKVGQELLMAVDLDSGPRHPVVTVSGKVVRCGRGDGRYPYSAAVSFADLEPEAWGILSRVEEHVAARTEAEPWHLRSDKELDRPGGFGATGEHTDGGRQLTESFMALSRTKEFAKLEARLKAQAALGSVTARRIGETAEGRLRRELSDIAREVEEVNVGKNALGAFLDLEVLEDRLTFLETAKMDRKDAKEREMLRVKLEGKIKLALSTWDETTRPLVQQVARTVLLAHHILEDIVSPTDTKTRQAGQVDLTDFTKRVQDLTDLIRRVEAVLDRAAGANKETLPAWALMEEARESIIKPHRRNIFLFTCAAAMARADGRICPVERDFLLSMAERIHISRDEAERLVRASSKIDPADFDGTLQEARDLLHKLYLCAMADGVVVEAETKVLKAIALKSGVPGAEIDAMLGERVHLAEASGRAREILRQVVQLIEKTRSGEPLDASVSLPAEIEKLAGCIAEIRAAVAKVPGGNVRDLPDWEMLRSARETIIKPHRRNMFLLKCAILMTRADGELSDVERKFLYDMSDRTHLPRSEADALIDSDPAAIQLSGFEGTAEEAKDLVHKLYLCALSDGVVHEEEKLLFERIVASLGVSQEEAMEPLMRDVLGPSATPLDVEKALRFLRSQEQLPRDTEFAEEMPAELLERIRGRFQIPEDEKVLLVYENRLMQQAIECAALTDRRLWVRTPRGRKEAIDVGMIKEFKAETGEATLVLTDGRTIGMTRTAVPFLKVLVPCVQECRRSA